MDNPNTTAPIGDDFAALLQEAQNGTPGAGPAQPGAEQGGAVAGAPSANVREFQICFDMIKAFPLIRKKLPHFHAAMTEPEMKESALALGAVFDKYGLSLSGLIEKYEVEVKAAMVFGSWTYALAGALIIDLDAMKAAKAAPAATEKKPEAPNGSQ